MEPAARVVCDSVNPAGHRLTTMEIQIHRFEWPAVLTHRKFSRNAASSRALGIERMIAAVVENPALPVKWGKAAPGMQHVELFEDLDEIDDLTEEWLAARDDAVRHAERLHAMGLHKQLVNRLIEPFAWHTGIITSTEWENFFQQRCTDYSDDPQPEIAAVADAMRAALADSKPVELYFDEWHIPYMQEGEWPGEFDLQTALKVGTARCARVSYLTQNGKRSPSKDVELFHRLIESEPPHWSPLEHCAKASRTVGLGNFDGWRQLRNAHDHLKVLR